jgi:hypothetical protein
VDGALDRGRARARVPGRPAVEEGLHRPGMEGRVTEAEAARGPGMGGTSRGPRDRSKIWRDMEWDWEGRGPTDDPPSHAEPRRCGELGEGHKKLPS